MGLLSDELFNAISQACREIMEGKFHEFFPVDMICLLYTSSYVSMMRRNSGRFSAVSSTVAPFLGTQIGP